MSGSPRRVADEVPGAATSASPAGPSSAAVADLFNELLRRTHLGGPSEMAAAIAGPARRIGARSVVLYLIDYEQRLLVPVAGPHDEDAVPLSVAGTVAGRAFSTTSILRSSLQEGRGQRLWLPLLDGTERLGVIGMSFEGEAVSGSTVLVCERYAHLAAMLIATKNAYGDSFETTRRRRPMTIASELLWQLAPPLVFAT
jgi:hypothetical protein